MTISYNDLEKLFPLLPADKRINSNAPVDASFDPDMNMTIATPSDLTAVEKTLQQYGQYAKKWVVTVTVQKKRVTDQEGLAELESIVAQLKAKLEAQEEAA